MADSLVGDGQHPRREAAGGKAASAPLMGQESEPTLFELSHPGRRAWSFRTTGVPELPLDQLVPVLALLRAGTKTL